jgi:hypothetical protein
LLPALVEIRFRFSQVISHLGSLPQASTRGDSWVPPGSSRCIPIAATWLATLGTTAVQYMVGIWGWVKTLVWPGMTQE